MLPAQLQLLIQSAEGGDPGAREQLFAALYQELHRLAQRELRRNALLTMSPTTLLHETYLNLSERDASLGRILGQASERPTEARRGV